MDNRFRMHKVVATFVKQWCEEDKKMSDKEYSLKGIKVNLPNREIETVYLIENFEIIRLSLKKL